MLIIRLEYPWLLLLKFLNKIYGCYRFGLYLTEFRLGMRFLLRRGFCSSFTFSLPLNLLTPSNEFCSLLIWRLLTHSNFLIILLAKYSLRSWPFSLLHTSGILWTYCISWFWFNQRSVGWQILNPRSGDFRNPLE